MRRCSLLLTVVTACASSSPRLEPQPVSAVVTAPAVAPPSDRLAASASYGDLVRAASELGDAARAADCLLARTGDGFQLRAELAAGVKPLPLPADDLEPLLKASDRVELLSAWGRHGDGSATLALVGFTLAAPARDAAAVLLTDRGLSVRGASGSGLVPRDELDLERAIGALAQQPDATVFVAAEAHVPLAAVADLLAVLGAARREVVLATNLSPDTRLPRPTPSAPAARCSDGLPATDQPEGELPREALIAALAPLKDAAGDCLARGDARGAAGGRLELALRVGGSGRVEDACLVRDELADDAIANCVIDLARRLGFPSPSPTGVIDVQLPVVLRPGSRVVQPPLCTP